MQSLKAFSAGTHSRKSEDAGFGRGIVLPRILRRPARLLARMEWRLPSNAGAKGVIGLFAATAIAGMIIGGHAMTVVAAVTTWTGLGIQNIEISGQSQASEVDILNNLAIGEFPSLLTFDLEAARERVEMLPWVETATLIKLFPGTLKVEVAERRPFAIWQHDGNVLLIDDAGAVIDEAPRDRFTDLPYVVGVGAAARIHEFMSLVAGAPRIAANVRAGLLVSGKRWTLVLENGIELLLPADRPEKALSDIAALDADKALLSREIAAVDFRFADRVFVRLTERGISEREALLKKRATAAARRRTGA